MNKTIPIDINFVLKLTQDQYDDLTILKFLNVLKEVSGAENFDGEASVQVLLPLKNGGYLRIGSTDNDVSSEPNSIFIDRYTDI